MDYSFRNAFVVEMSNLLAQNEIFEQSRAAFSSFERVLIVVDPHALIGGEKFAAAVFSILLQVVDLGRRYFVDRAWRPLARRPEALWSC